MGVLQQVRAGLVAEPVGVFMLGCRVCVIGHDSSDGRYYIFFWFFLKVWLMKALYHMKG
jgi:hypothetical protein